MVITIVILIILATISMGAIFGDKGLTNQAEYAKDLSENSTKKEEESMANLAEYMNEVLGEDGGSDPEEPFEPKPTPPPEEGGADISSQMTNGVIEIKWLEGTSNKVVDVPNAPVIKRIYLMGRQWSK